MNPELLKCVMDYNKVYLLSYQCRIRRFYKDTNSNDYRCEIEFLSNNIDLRLLKPYLISYEIISNINGRAIGPTGHPIPAVYNQDYVVEGVCSLKYLSKTPFGNYELGEILYD